MWACIALCLVLLLTFIIIETRKPNATTEVSRTRRRRIPLWNRRWIHLSLRQTRHACLHNGTARRATVPDLLRAGKVGLATRLRYDCKPPEAWADNGRSVFLRCVWER